MNASRDGARLPFHITEEVPHVARRRLVGDLRDPDMLAVVLRRLGRDFVLILSMQAPLLLQLATVVVVVM